MARACIYCGKRSEPFRSVEHVVPESLGNHELVLPRGVVCDPCNNGVLSQVDEALVTFEPLAMLRAARGVPSKSGRVKAFSVPGLAVRQGTVRFTDVDGADPAQLPGTVERDLTQRMDERLAAGLARALLKQMLGGMYRDHRRKFVLQPRFDGLRAVILGHEPYRGVLAVSRHWDLATYQRGACGFAYNFVGSSMTPPMWVEGAYLGLTFVATWGRAPSGEMAPALPSLVKETYNVVEVDPRFGVR